MVERCLWTDLRPPAPARTEPPPEDADVAIVGGGYTGLAAARAIARRGGRAVVLEQQTAGWGASSRNGGFVLTGYKLPLEPVARTHGAGEARRLFALTVEAVLGLERLIAEEGIECGYRRTGTVTLAARPGHVAALDRSRRFLRDVLGHDTALLGPEALRAEIGSSRYHGGLLDELAGAVQPAALAQGLARAAERAGACLVEQATVRSVGRRGDGFALETSRGPVRARDVLIATNGYTGPTVPALQRRVVPVGSYLVATPPLDPALAAQLIPRGRVLSDTKQLLYYFRLSPDGRMVFGGRAAFTPTPIARSAGILARGMREVFPALAATPIEYAWGGAVAFTLDQMPHAGRLDGLHYALGYGGHGVALATWLGARMGEAIAGAGELPRLTAPFRPVPCYQGRPWFLPLVGGYYRVRDWIG